MVNILVLNHHRVNLVALIKIQMIVRHTISGYGILMVV